MMPAPDIVRRVIAALNQAKIPHMLVGSFARNYYAEPRSTKDADVVLALTKAELAEFLAALGPDFRLDEQMSFETITGTTRTDATSPSIAATNATRSRPFSRPRNEAFTPHIQRRPCDRARHPRRRQGERSRDGRPEEGGVFLNPNPK